jgi:predicted house-cleaning noncanonical NTP pyrophosphatase (MazG superfamily)
MKSKTADITAKYQKMIDNIQWHLKTNKPTDKMELQKLYQQINDYREMIVDLETVASQFQHPVPDEAGEVRYKNLPNNKLAQKINEYFETHTAEEVHEALDEARQQRLSPAPPSGEDAGKGLTEEKFCKIYTGYHGEEIDNIKQLVKTTFTGNELLEFCKFVIEQSTKP